MTLVYANPEMVIGKTLTETKDLDWHQCYPIVDGDNRGIITGVWLATDGEPNPEELLFDVAAECFRPAVTATITGENGETITLHLVYEEPRYHWLEGSADGADTEVSANSIAAAINAAIGVWGYTQKWNLSLEVYSAFIGQNYDLAELNRKYGHVKHDDRILYIAQQPYMEDYSNYRATAIDAAGNDYTIRWPIVDSQADDASDTCDWDTYTVVKG